MQLSQTVTLFELINHLKIQKKTFPYCVYGRGRSDRVTLDDQCLIEEYSQITDDDEEIFPDIITRKGLEFWFTDELLEDVLFSALKQKPTITNDEILDAIKYYNAHDQFMSL
ncbi:DUF7716 domain-containing protein [Pseudomonas kitaguniensis]|uniref:DUF7716 domain-containing protein n=1 Tax=Pseudomonas kitaguniensis TaxID=2607908 RepID=UPI003D05D4F9